jgi:hypothetical protein
MGKLSVILPSQISSTVTFVAGRLLASIARSLKAQLRKFGTRQIVIANRDHLSAFIIRSGDVDPQPGRSVAAIWVDACTHGAI